MCIISDFWNLEESSENRWFRNRRYILVWKYFPTECNCTLNLFSSIVFLIQLFFAFLFLYPFEQPDLQTTWRVVLSGKCYHIVPTGLLLWPLTNLMANEFMAICPCSLLVTFRITFLWQTGLNIVVFYYHSLLWEWKN